MSTTQNSVLVKRTKNVGGISKGSYYLATWHHSQNTHFFRKGKLTSCFLFFGFSGCAMLNRKQFFLLNQIQTSQTGGQPYSDTSPYLTSALINYLVLATSCVVINYTVEMKTKNLCQ